MEENPLIKSKEALEGHTPPRSYVIGDVKSKRNDDCVDLKETVNAIERE